MLLVKVGLGGSTDLRYELGATKLGAFADVLEGSDAVDWGVECESVALATPF